MKILHINYALERGGIETWLLRLVKCFSQNEIQFALAYHRSGSASMAADLEKAGVELLTLPSPRSPLKYLKAYRELLRTAGPFNAVHAHVNFSGLIMLGARQEGVPVRLAHAHVSAGLMTRGLIAGSYTRLTNSLFLRHMTHAIGVSPNAATALFGYRWKHDTRFTLEPCGIDLAAFDKPAKTGIRTALSIPEHALVLGMVGRLSEEKNQAFALKLVAEITGNTDEVHLLLVGDGPARDQLQQLCQQLDISSRVHFLGERQDVPGLLNADIDVLLMPSKTEGAPLTIIEAQAAGVPSVVSTAVPEKSILASEQVCRLSLGLGVKAWAKQVAQAHAPPSPEPVKLLENTPFNIWHNAQLLDTIYRTHQDAAH